MSVPHIETHNAWVEFPIFDAKTRSLKKAFLGKAGGAIGRNESNVVVIEALRDITMSLELGDRVGLVGHNGAGKSTLLRLLSGIYEPTRGVASVTGRVAPVFDLGVGMDPEISGFENIIIRGLFLGQTRKQMLAKVDEIAEFTELGDYLSMPLRTYSTGMRVRLAMGVVTSIDPEILLLDEGIGAVDAEFLKKAQTRLQSLVERSGILVFASHSNEFLARLCKTAMWIDHGTIKMTGGIEDVVRAYEGEDAARHVREVLEEHRADWLQRFPMTESVCAVVVTHRRPDELAKSLDAVSAQTRAPDHLVVVDNDDDARVRDIVNGQPVATTYLGSRRNLGGAGGFALGMLHALALGADWVWLADDDGRPLDSEVLGTLLACASKHGLAEVSPMVCDMADPQRLAFPLRRGLVWRRRVSELRTGTEDLLPGIASLFNGALFRASTLDAVGVPDLRLFVRGDETELHRRLLRSGLPFGTCLNAVYLHPQGSDEFKPILGGRMHTQYPDDAAKRYFTYRNRGYLQSMPGMRKLVFQEWMRFGWYFLVSRRDPAGLREWIRLRRLGRREKFERPAQ